MALLPAQIRCAIEAHARFAFPEEACGLLALDREGRVRMAYCLTNADASPHRFTVDPDEHYGALCHAERQGWRIGGSFHSHPRSSPLPSDADVEGALDPTWIHVIAGPVDPGPVEIRAYAIATGSAEEVEA